MLIILIVGCALQTLYDIFVINRISQREAKKACYDCNKCHNWRCYYWYCKKKREEKVNNEIR